MLVRRSRVDSDSDCSKWVFDPGTTRIARSGFLQKLTFKVQYWTLESKKSRLEKTRAIDLVLGVANFQLGLLGLTRIARIARIDSRNPMITIIGFRKSIFGFGAIRAKRVDPKYERVTKISELYTFSTDVECLCREVIMSAHSMS